MLGIGLTEIIIIALVIIVVGVIAVAAIAFLLGRRSKD